MAMIHTINKSPFQIHSLDSCLKYSSSGGAILFIEDGVYAAMNNTAIADKVVKAMESYKIYALEPDVKARGLDTAKVLDGIQLVDYSGYVDLVTEHDNVQSWL